MMTNALDRKWPTERLFAYFELDHHYANVLLEVIYNIS